MLTDDQISEILLPLMPLKDPYTFARAVEAAVLARSAPPVTRNLAVMTWREVCGSDSAMAILPPTGRMLEEFAVKIVAALRARPYTRTEADAIATAERERCLHAALAEIGDGFENLAYRVATAIRSA